VLLAASGQVACKQERACADKEKEAPAFAMVGQHAANDMRQGIGGKGSRGGDVSFSNFILAWLNRTVKVMPAVYLVILRGNMHQQRIHPDIVPADFKMPHMTGPELAMKMRQPV